MLTIGLSSGALYPGTRTEQVPAAARRMGFDQIELMLQTTGEYAPEFLGDVQRETGEGNVAVHAVHPFQPLHPLFTHYPRRSDEAIELFRRAVAGSALLGANLVVWHGPTRREVQNDPTWSRFLEVTDQLAGICAEHGLVLGVENVSWCVLANVRDVIRMSASLPSLANGRHVGFVFDSFQAFEADANPFMMLAAMESRLADVHLSDGRRGEPEHRHLLPGDGDLPWPALIKAIHGTGYSGPMMLEASIRSTDDVERVRNLLLPLIHDLGRADDVCERPLPAGVREGIVLFNRGEFYEAHEVIEHEWHAERGTVRALYQGILQIGVGLHHTRNGNYRGAELLLGDGIEKVSRFLPACQGVDTALLVHQAGTCLEHVQALGPERISLFDWSLVPKIDID